MNSFQTLIFTNVTNHDVLLVFSKDYSFPNLQKLFTEVLGTCDNSLANNKQRKPH